MDSPRPEWLQHALDGAQIISALGTLAAVWAAIWLALRNEAQRLKFFSGFRQGVPSTLGTAPLPWVETLLLSLTIVNAGMMPVQVDSVTLRVRLRQGSWSASLRPQSAAAGLEGSITINHGESMTYYFPVRADERPWSHRGVASWFWQKPRFEIFTSLGKSYVHRIDSRVYATLMFTLFQTE